MIRSRKHLVLTFASVAAIIVAGVPRPAVADCFIYGQKLINGVNCTCNNNQCPPTSYPGFLYGYCMPAPNGVAGEDHCTPSPITVATAFECEGSVNWAGLSYCLAANWACIAACAAITGVTLGGGLFGCIGCFVAFSGACAYPCYLSTCSQASTATISIVAEDAFYALDGDPCEGGTEG